MSHKATYKTFRGDFLPYAQKHEFRDEWDYWTGYYTTRPKLKQMIVDTMRDI